jgi:hypothetical protein
MKTKGTNCVLNVKEGEIKEILELATERSRKILPTLSQCGDVRWQFRLLYSFFCLSGCQES